MTDAQLSSLLAVLLPQVVALVVTHHGLDEKSATRAFFASRLYAELSDESRKLWHYSPEQLFSMYDEEVKTGGITYPEVAS